MQNREITKHSVSYVLKNTLTSRTEHGLKSQLNTKCNKDKFLVDERICQQKTSITVQINPPLTFMAFAV